MTVDFITTEALTDDQILKEFGETLLYGEGKFRRGRVNEDDIITEIADVMIMCEQMATYFGKDKVALEKENKLERLEERLAKYEWEQGN